MANRELLDHSLELLAPLGPLRSRRMFGGWGVYVDEVFIAIIAFDQLYLKVDDTTRAQFVAAGAQPFQYQRQGQLATLGYFTAPEEAMESPAAMAHWGRLALGAALRARAAAAKKPEGTKQPKAATMAPRKKSARA